MVTTSAKTQAVLATLKQTPEVQAVQEAVNSWPRVSVRAFLNQSDTDEEMNHASQVMLASKDAAIALVALQHTDSEDPERLRALDTLLTDASDGGMSLLQVFADALFALGVAYGVRIAAAGEQR